MTERNTHLMVAPLTGRKVPPIFWTLLALAIAGLVLLPLLSVLWIALHPQDNIWPHLIATSLPRYVKNTLVLALGTGLLAAAVGVGAAWLVTMYRFPLSRALEWLLLLPLAVPAYVGAFVVVDFLDYSGPAQTALRGLMGWQTSRDYWFPEIRSPGMAVIVLTSTLYPYVYMLARAAFREQSSGVYDVARALGSGPFRLFWRVGLPLARPAVAAGTAIVMMEVVNDYGVVSFFSVQTLTTGIFNTWLEAGNIGGAAQIACLMLGAIFALMALERAGRERLRFHQTARQGRPVTRQTLRAPAGWLATGLCLLPFLLGFVMPVVAILSHALGGGRNWADAGLLRALANTVGVCGMAAVLTVTASLLMVYGVRLGRSRAPRRILPLTTIGYAAPGAVLALGMLIPLAAFDHRLADAILALTGHDPGLLLTGSAAALVLVFSVRFFAVAQGAIDSAFGRVPPSLPMAARSLGRAEAGTLTAVYLPLMKGSVGTALLLVFVDAAKELPATLLLRPFNFNTLATRTYESASLEDLGSAAPAALCIIAVSLIAVLLLARASHRPADH
ncbi:MAG: iron ABC transporter permease [Paracoccaceae bacterium]